MEWTKEQYNKQYEKWVPWLEDMYLHYFTKDNKTSYTAKRKPSLLICPPCSSCVLPPFPVPASAPSPSLPYHKPY